MWSKYDQLSKGVLSRALAPVGTVATQHEITGEVQAADIWFQPAPGRGPGRAIEWTRLGVLGRMAEGPCLIEPFHATPSANQVLSCMTKQHNLRTMLLRESARQPGAPAWPRALLPRLWILSAGHPEQVIHALDLRRMNGWPEGFWQLAGPLLRVHLVVLRDLPETRDTLLLRLLGRDRTFQRAMHELLALPEHAWERELAIPQLVIAYRIENPQTSEEEDMSYLDEMQTLYEEWKAEIKREGEQAGWEKGEQAGWEKGEQAGWLKALRRLYESRFGALPPGIQAALEATDDIDTLQQWVACFATRTPEEIEALVRAPR